MGRIISRVWSRRKEVSIVGVYLYTTRTYSGKLRALIVPSYHTMTWLDLPVGRRSIEESRSERLHVTSLPMNEEIKNIIQLVFAMLSKRHPV